MSGTVAMGAGIGACYVLVPRALALLLDQAPDVVVTMREGAMEEHFAMLRDGRLDLVVGRVEPALVDRDFAMDELYDPAVHIVAGPQHPLARASQSSWAKPRRAGLDPAAGGNADARRHRAHFPARETAAAALHDRSRSSIQTNVSLMNARDMLWVLSEDITAYFERLGLLKRLPVETLRTAAPLSAVRMRGRACHRPAARLVDCLQTAAREIAEG